MGTTLFVPSFYLLLQGNKMGTMGTTLFVPFFDLLLQGNKMGRPCRSPSLAPGLSKAPIASRCPVRTSFPSLFSDTENPVNPVKAKPAQLF